MKVSGQRSPLGMVPTQMLRSPSSGRQRDGDGLVDEMILAKCQSVTEIHLEQVAILNGGVHLGLERDETVLASRLRLVEGDVGIT